MRTFGVKIPLALLLLVVGSYMYYQVLVLPGEIEMSDHLQRTIIDFESSSMHPEHVYPLLHRKLSEKNPFFRECRFQVHPSSSGASVRLDLKDCPGYEVLRYISEISEHQYRLRSRTIVITPKGSGLQGAIDRAKDWVLENWRQLKAKVTGVPYDPFAPP